jgi:hypothetical protein
MMLTTNEWIAIVAAVAVAVGLIVWLIATRSSRQQHAMLKRRFGPEYERAVQEHGDVSRAERDLRERQKRVESLQLKPLTEADRTRFSADWDNVQARFVDDPSGAVGAADDLIKSVMLARGYSEERFDQRVADLSVEHGTVVHHYRAARVLAEANREGRANTEELRQAFVHYRALFADLLQKPQVQGAKMQEARA